MAGFLYIKHLGVVAEREKTFKASVEAYKSEVEKSARIAAELEAELVKQRDMVNKLREELQDEVKVNPTYRNCIVPANGMRLLKQAVIGPTTR